ncbi:MAG: ribosome biogenesis GTPase Der [Pseudomonadota bacterium]
MLVAIVGRPNVGKSTLFNRLVGYRKSIVDDIPGVTRDRIYGELNLDKFADIHDSPGFTVIDTGGLEENPDDDMENNIVDQARFAIEEADLILALFDVSQGLMPTDQHIYEILKKSGKDFFIVVNKVDNSEREIQASEFYSLGADEIFTISALHGVGIFELVQRVINKVDKSITHDTDDSLKIAIVGRPNVGKSSIVNCIIGKERMVVSEMAGTTRDAIDTTITYHKQKLTLIDTAGIRRKSKINQRLERYSVIRAFKSIDRADIVCVVLDARDYLTDQDLRIAAYANDKLKGFFFVINKWDLVEKDSNTINHFRDMIHHEAKTLSFAPSLFISALENQRVFNILEYANKVYENAKLRISTGELNRFFNALFTKFPPPSMGHKPFMIKFSTQVSACPVVFKFFTKNPEKVPESYRRFMASKIRDEYGFSGVPLKLKFTSSSKYK